MKKTIKAITGILLVASLAGCASETALTPPSPSASAIKNPYGGFAVDNPGPNEIILTVSSATKSKDFTVTELKKLATETITIEEPFVKQEQSFTGVPLQVLFDAVGIKPADKVSTAALNDYKYEDTAEKFLASKGMLAISRDGSDIPMDQGGPIRIVFPTGTEYFTFMDAWNWSLRTISIVE